VALDLAGGARRERRRRRNRTRRYARRPSRRGSRRGRLSPWECARRWPGPASSRPHPASLEEGRRSRARAEGYRNHRTRIAMKT
jgi:hypothetical protein